LQRRGNQALRFRHWADFKGFIDRGVAGQAEVFTRVRGSTDHVREVVEILSVNEGGSLSGREPLFAAKLAEFETHADDPIYQPMARIMSSSKVG